MSKTKDSQDTIKLAQVKRAYGIKGELFILPLSSSSSHWIYDLSQITLRPGQVSKEGSFQVSKVPQRTESYKVESLRTCKKGYVLKLQGVDDRTEAEKLQGAFVEIPFSIFKSQPGENIYLMELKGFMVVDRGQEIGPVVGFSSNGPQDLLQVDKNGALYDIPFVTDFLIRIDWQTQRIYMNLPEGLFDLPSS